MSDQIDRLVEAAMSLNDPPEIGPAQDAVPAIQAPAAELAAGSPRIMVVDDDDGFRTMIRDWLSEEGLSDIDEARDGAEAVELATETRPDLILMDVRMPRMNGIEAAERIRDVLPTVQIV